MESGTIENAQISQLLRSGTPEFLNSNADITLDDFIEPISSPVEVFDAMSTTYRSTKTVEIVTLLSEASKLHANLEFNSKTEWEGEINFLDLIVKMLN